MNLECNWTDLKTKCEKANLLNGTTECPGKCSRISQNGAITWQKAVLFTKRIREMAPNVEEQREKRKNNLDVVLKQFPLFQSASSVWKYN